MTYYIRPITVIATIVILIVACISLVAPNLVSRYRQMQCSQRIEDLHGMIIRGNSNLELFWALPDSPPASINITAAKEISACLNELNQVNGLSIMSQSVDEIELAEILNSPFRSRMISITIENSPSICDKTLETLSQIESLKFIALTGPTGEITTHGFSAFKHMPNVTQLSARAIPCNVYIGRLLDACPSLKEIDLFASSVTDDGIRLDRRNDHIRKLVLNGTRVTDEGVSNLVKLQSIRELDLGSLVEITDASVEDLSKMDTLKYLSVWKTGISADGYRRLKLALPKCTIVGPEIVASEVTAIPE